MSAVRTFLDRIYFASGVVAALFLIAILALIVIQMVARWTGEVFPGAPDYAGYCMAAASFFAFAYALNHGAHIRVSILLNAVGKKSRRWLEAWCFTIATALAWHFAYYAIKATYWSWKFNDISQGQDASPLWIPQLSMVIGSVIFAIALTDHLVHVFVTGDHRIQADVVDESHGE
ncbi:MAG: TRAP transporter small permease subunit [Rhodospirillaceae bacterium]|jgi:TRAP-type C4-dicarboxylate transport system permease small subunit|nr:TRAP transporter small permease subunit [Rhodospirillaceae bacterium]MBT5513362.1 TRAP transporter small permease subunit [Rhodospirillaceae bacterium]